VLSVAINLAVVWDSWREAHRRLVLALLPPAFVGLLVGVEVLAAVDPALHTAGRRDGGGVLGAVAVAGDKAADGRHVAGTVIAGSASGALSTSTGLAGPPVVLLFTSRGLPKHAFRGSSALYFLVLSLAGIAALYHRGLVTGEHLPLSLALVPAAFAGKLAGTALLSRFSDKAFRALTLSIVIVTGAWAPRPPHGR
jgi:uncharacterized membrane protein YfcA